MDKKRSKTRGDGPERVLRPQPEHIELLQRHMERLADRNPGQEIARQDYKELYSFLAVQKITFLYDDELFEHLIFVDHHKTGIPEEALDAFMVLDQGEEIELKLFQFKFRQAYDGGISTKDLFAFVDRMNRIFLRQNLLEKSAIEGFNVVFNKLNEVRANNKRAKRTRVQCYYIVNGQNVSPNDFGKIDEIRQIFAPDRQSYGFTFETYGGIEICDLIVKGRVPIQEEVIELLEERGPEPILFHEIGKNPNGMPIKVLVGYTNVNQLVRLVDRYSNNELFEMNVRYFLGASRDVNSRIIDTVTSDQSIWFGFMNNGVSITAERVVVDQGGGAKKVKLHLSNMQIINGCQTVNALYHAKYSEELKDKFQGNSSVMVRIYEIEPDNRQFLNALIVATNAQNAIRPQDLLANDPVQKALERAFAAFGVIYERKAGDSVGKGVQRMVLSKEDAGLSFWAILEGKPEKLRGGPSRREFFGRGKDYFRVFNLFGDELSDDDLELQFKQTTEDYELNAIGRQRALEMFFAWRLDQAVDQKIAKVRSKDERGTLRKGRYFISRLIFVAREKDVRSEMVASGLQSPGHEQILRVRNLADKLVTELFGEASSRFKDGLQSFVQAKSTNIDAALKHPDLIGKLESTLIESQQDLLRLS